MKESIISQSIKDSEFARGWLRLFRTWLTTRVVRTIRHRASWRKQQGQERGFHRFPSLSNSTSSS